MWATTIVTKTPNRYGDPSKSVDILLGKPTVGSRASLILLNDYFRGLELQSYIDKYNIDLSEYKDIKISKSGLIEIVRSIFDKRYLDNSDKVCEYCNKQCYTHECKNNRHDTATVDHKNPLVDCCYRFDEDNIAVCCYSCNNKKGQLLYDEWMLIVEEEKNKVRQMYDVRKFVSENATKILEKILITDNSETLLEIVTFASSLRNTIETALLSDMPMDDVKGAREDYKLLSKLIVEANCKSEKILNPDLEIDSVKILKQYLHNNKKWQRILCSKWHSFELTNS